MPKRSSKTLTDASVRKIKPPASGQQEHFDAALPGFALRVSSTGSKSYVFNYRINGRRRRLTIGDVNTHTLADARDEARAARIYADKGLDPIQQREAEKKRNSLAALQTFKAAREEFLKRYTGSRSKPLKERTRTEYKRYLEVDFADWDNRPISAITSQGVRSALRDIVDRKAPVGANRALAALRVFFNWAADEELIEASPAAGIKKLGSERDYRDGSNSRFLSADELKTIWCACEPKDVFGDIVRILILTGQRKGEVMQMRWQDISEKKISLADGRTINATIWTIPGGVEGVTKNQISHDVYLPALAVDIIRNRDEIKDNPYVFAGRRKGRHFNGFSKAKLELDLACGISDWRLHDLRRTFVTMLNDDPLRIRSEVVEAIVNHVTGHKAGVAGVYNRATYDVERHAAMDAWGRYIEAIITGSPRENVVHLTA